MSRKARRIIKILGVAYLAALVLFLVAASRGRNRYTRPVLISTPLEVPQRSAFDSDEAFEAYKDSIVRAGHLMHGRDAGVEANTPVDREVLSRLIEANPGKITVWDRRLVREFAARNLEAGEKLLSADGALVIADVHDELDVPRLTRMALEYDQQTKEEDRHEKIWVKGTGSLIGFDLTLVFAALNFLWLAALLYAFLWEPITRLLDDRAQAIRDDVDSARRGREEAEELRQVREAELGRLREDADRLRTEGRARGEAERARLVEDGRAEARRVAERQERAFAAEVESARKDAVRGLGGLSVELASKVLAREVSLADHERMVDGFVAKLAEESDKDAQD